MSECIRCGHNNPSDAQACRMCGEMLLAMAGAGVPALEAGALAGPAYTAAPRNELFYHYARARNFILFVFLLLLLAIASPLYRHVTGAGLPFTWNVGPNSALGLGLYLWLLHAFLVGQTGRATGVGFWKHFALALAPPLIPWAWASIANIRPWKPYILCLVTLSSVTLLTWPLREVGWAVQLLWLAALPLLISAWMGGSVIGLARILGLNAYLAGAWVCIMPALTLGLMLWEWNFAGIVEDWLAGARDPQALWHGLAAVADFSALPLEVNVMAVGWGLVCLLLWIKAVHDNLRFPIM